jgi:hypothetical protein
LAELSERHRLWVPMQVQALAFGRAGTAQFLDLTPVYRGLQDLAEAPLGHKLRPKLDQARDPDFLKSGIHLHWTLPAAFTHMRPTAGGDTLLPDVPDRWVVIRLWETEPGTLKQRSWVVESDRRDENGTGAPWFEKANGNYLFTRLGCAEALDVWTEPRKSAEPRKATESLKAFAAGNLAFAAFYPSCRGVFGFHDKADDLPVAPAETVCTYLVAGWFADPTSDPLNVFPLDESVLAKMRPEERGLKPEELWEQRMRQNQWAIPKDSAFWPTTLTCYGIAQGVAWKSDAPCNAVQQRSTPRVAIGNSFMEAVAALTKGSGTESERDRLVNEAQLAALAERHPARADTANLDVFFKDLGQMLGQLLGARAKVHERAFAAQPGGSLWEIVRQDEIKTEDSNAQPLVRLPAEVSSQLLELNNLQHQYDEIARTFAGWQRRLFGAWYQHQYWSTRPRRSRPSAEQIAALLKERKDSEREAANWAVALSQLSLAGARSSLETVLRDKMPTASLISRAMPRFWCANDPFVLMAGLSVPTVQGGASPLQCRVSDQTISSIEVREPVAGYGSIQVRRTDLQKHLQQVNILPPRRDGIPPDLTDLLLDALFAVQERAGVLARVWLLPRYRNPNDQQIRDVTSAIGNTQATGLGGAVARVSRQQPAGDLGSLLIEGLGESALRSFLSAINLASEATPRPVFMVWEGKWHPYCQDKTQAVSDHWEFSKGVDYELRQPPPGADGKPFVVNGFTLIASNLERGLAATKQHFAEQQYAFVFNALAQLAGQSLVGLTDAFATKDAGPQVPPLASSPESGELSRDRIADLIGNQYAAAPRPGGRDDESLFSPIRGGHFSLTRLLIVDSFGRIQEITDAPIIGRMLAIPGLPGSAHLPPRLIQPARLLLRWMSAVDDGQESLGDIGTSPICGFIVLNRLDRSLLIYGASKTGQLSVGELLGAVQAVRLPQGQEIVRWSAIPGPPSATSSGRALTEAEIPNRHLRHFVNGLLALTGKKATFEAVRSYLDRRDAVADLSLDQGLQSVLIGRPLALVRASLRLELDGLPLTDQSAKQILSADHQKQEPWFLSVQFPVRLGGRRLGPDGLVGYFVDDGTSAAYQKLRVSTDENLDPTVEANAYFDQSGLNVTCDPQAQAIKLTLLLDPKEGVHVVSGILPTNLINIPRPLVTEALSDLEVPFLVAPVLGERLAADVKDARMRMPLPTNDDGEWRWLILPDPNAGSSSPGVPVSADTAAAPSLSTTMMLHEGWLKYRPLKGERK